MRNPPKTAIIGANGLVGQVLFENYRRIYPDLIGTDWQGRAGLSHLDLVDPHTFPLELAKSEHRWAVICAGIRDYQTCEEKRTYTRERNVIGTLALARHLHSLGLHVVAFSSDGVFDGQTGGYSDDSPLHPVNEYGRQKQELERRLQEETAGHCLILRIGRVVGVKKGDGTLPDTIAHNLVLGQRVDAARDQIFNSVLADDLPRVLFALQSVNAEGVFNVAEPKAYSRLEIAWRLADGLKIARSLIRAISVDEIGGGVPRPKNLSMRCERLARVLPLPLTPTSQCLERVIQNYSIPIGEQSHAN